MHFYIFYTYLIGLWGSSQSGNIYTSTIVENIQGSHTTAALVTQICDELSESWILCTLNANWGFMFEREIYFTKLRCNCKHLWDNMK